MGDLSGFNHLPTGSKSIIASVCAVHPASPAGTGNSGYPHNTDLQE